LGEVVESTPPVVTGEKEQFINKRVVQDKRRWVSKHGTF